MAAENETTLDRAIALLKPETPGDIGRLAFAAVLLIISISQAVIPVSAIDAGQHLSCGTPIHHWVNGSELGNACTQALTGHLVRAFSLFATALALAFLPLMDLRTVRITLVIMSIMVLANASNALRAGGGVFDGVIAVLLLLALAPVAQVNRSFGVIEDDDEADGIDETY